PPAPRASLARAWATTFALTLTNPMTIVSFAAVFAGLGLADAPDGRAGALLMVAGVFLGSALWWVILTGAVSLLRGRLTPARMAWVNRASGAVIAAFGVAALASLLAPALPALTRRFGG
ncbi:MAG: LysE family transporter, partial [Chloroflexota bacterium]